MTSNELADGIASFLRERKEQLAPAERAAFLKSLVTVEQFLSQEESACPQALTVGTREHPPVTQKREVFLDL